MKIIAYIVLTWRQMMMPGNFKTFSLSSDILQHSFELSLTQIWCFHPKNVLVVLKFEYFPFGEGRLFE